MVMPFGGSDMRLRGADPRIFGALFGESRVLLGSRLARRQLSLTRSQLLRTFGCTVSRCLGIHQKSDDTPLSVPVGASDDGRHVASGKAVSLTPAVAPRHVYSTRRRDE